MQIKSSVARNTHDDACSFSHLLPVRPKHDRHKPTFFSRRCPANNSYDNADSSIVVKANGGGRVVQFQFRAFEWVWKTGYTKTSIYVHCEIEGCYNDMPSCNLTKTVSNGGMLILTRLPDCQPLSVLLYLGFKLLFSDASSVPGKVTCTAVCVFDRDKVVAVNFCTSHFICSPVNICRVVVVIF